MSSPHPIDINRLARAWIYRDRISKSLERIFREVQHKLMTVLEKPESPVYSITLNAKDPSLSIKKRRGPLKKAMKYDIWTWLGIYPYDGELYFAIEIGFLKDKYDKHLRQFEKKALENGFEKWPYEIEELDGKTYSCIGFEKSRKLGALLRDKRNFRKQLDAVLNWVSAVAPEIPRLLTAIESDLKSSRSR